MVMLPPDNHPDRTVDAETALLEATDDDVIDGEAAVDLRDEQGRRVDR